MIEVILVLLMFASVACFASVVQSADATAGVAGTVTTTTETIIMTGGFTAVESPTCKVAVRGWISFVVGTGTTNFIVSVYRGTSIVVGNRILFQGFTGFVAGSSYPISFAVTDTLVNASGAQYCVTVTQTGAGGNGTFNAGTIETMVLSG